MDDRKQIPATPSSCFKCKATLPSLSALEVHLRSCTTEWEPPQSVPWTFIPPPDSLGAPGPAAGARRGGCGSRGRAASRRRGSDNMSSGGGPSGGNKGEGKSSFSQAEGQGTTGSDTQGRGGRQGRGRGAGGERNGNEGGRGRGNRGSTRTRKQNTENPESNSTRHNQRGHQGTQGRRSSSSPNPSQPSSGSPKSNRPPPRNGISQSPDQAQAKKSRPTGPNCSKCQLSFANSQELVHHFNTSPAHPNSGFSPPSPSSTSTLPAPQPRSPTSGPSHCTKCDIEFDCPNDLAIHFRESQDHPFSLPIVGYRYGVPVFDVEDSEWQFGVFDPKDDVTEEEHEETVIRRAGHLFEDIDEDESELICAMRRFDLGEISLIS